MSLQDFMGTGDRIEFLGLGSKRNNKSKNIETIFNYWLSHEK